MIYLHTKVHIHVTYLQIKNIQLNIQDAVKNKNNTYNLTYLRACVLGTYRTVMIYRQFCIQ